MNFIDAVKTCFQKYATFSGRASRSEYWWWGLFLIIVMIVTTEADSSIWGDDKRWLFRAAAVLLALPSTAVMIRRLHVINRSGWWISIWFALLYGIDATDFFSDDSIDLSRWPWLLGYEMAVFGMVILLGLAFLVAMLMPGTRGPNRFGPDPLEGHITSA